MGDRKIYKWSIGRQTDRYSHSCLPRPVGPVPFWIFGPFFSPRWLQQVTPHRRTLAPPPAVTHTLPIIPGDTAKNQSEVSLFSRVPQFEQNSRSMIGWEISLCQRITSAWLAVAAGRAELGKEMLALYGRQWTGNGPPYRTDRKKSTLYHQHN